MKNPISHLFISKTTTIRKAMLTITKAARLQLPVGICLVTDPDGHLIGTVTDGDIRRSLVKGINLDDKVEQIMAKNPITVDEDLTVDQMIRTVINKVEKSRRIRDFKVDKVIIVDKNKRVVDIRDFSKLLYKQEIKFKNICILGTGFIGLPLAVTLAENNYQVYGIDSNKSLIERLNKGDVPFYEKGVQPLLKFHLKEKNIKFSSSLRMEQADVYIICVGTPVEKRTFKPLLRTLKKAISDVGRVLKKDDLVILRSTVPVGTTRDLALPLLESISGLKAERDFFLVFAPERTVEGRALEEIKEIPQILGGVNKPSVQMAARLFQSFNPSVVMMDSLEQAEMVKLINNSFRDLTFAFANNIALLCEKLNLDVVKIIKAANEGYPRNPVALPSPGVGGYCLTKDPYLIAAAAETTNVDASLFLESRKVNNEMPRLVAGKIVDFLKIHWPTESKMKIFILGFAYKGYPETSDMRGSTTLDILKLIRNKMGNKISICGYDPVVPKSDIETLKVEFSPLKKGFENAHCVLLLNNNPEFSKMDIFSLLGKMKKPGLFFDGWQIFFPQEIQKIEGIVYKGLSEGYS